MAMFGGGLYIFYGKVLVLGTWNFNYIFNAFDKWQLFDLFPLINMNDIVAKWVFNSGG